MNDIPQHVAVVMDGNGRWAANQGLMRADGHRAGVESVKTIIECCLNKNIPVLSLFTFSSENWSRPAVEIECLLDLFLNALREEIQKLHKNGVALRFTGSTEVFSPSLQKAMQEATELTAGNDRLILNILINYGGRWDITQAAKKMAEEICKGQLDPALVDENLFQSYLSTADLPEPDLLIRTSGEQRISNFFLWQLAYTEFYFMDTYWPDFGAADFEAALHNFRSRERRFGKVPA